MPVWLDEPHPPTKATVGDHQGVPTMAPHHRALASGPTLARKAQKQQFNTVKTKQEKNPRKQHHCFCSQKCHKRGKKTREVPNTRKKLLPTENKLGTNRKSRKVLHNGKTVTTRPTLSSQTRCQRGKKIFQFQFLKKKWTNQIFLKKNLKISIGRENPHMCVDWTLKNAWTNQGLANRVHDAHHVREL